jgi:hypothetical protein
VDRQQLAHYSGVSRNPLYYLNDIELTLEVIHKESLSCLLKPPDNLMPDPQTIAFTELMYDLAGKTCECRFREQEVGAVLVVSNLSQGGRYSGGTVSVLLAVLS